MTTESRVRQANWRKDREVRVLHGVRPSQPRRPRVMQGLAARLILKRSQGRPRAGYGAAKRVEFRGADAVLLAGKQHPPRANGLRTRSLAQSETPCARGEVLSLELGRSHPCPASTPDRPMKATAERWAYTRMRSRTAALYR